MNLRIGDAILSALRVSTIAVLPVFTLFGQANDPVMPRHLFSVPEVTLALAKSSGPSNAGSSNDDASSDLFSVSGAQTNASLVPFSGFLAALPKPEEPAASRLSAELTFTRRAITRSLEKYSRLNGDWLLARKSEEIKDKVFPEPEVIRVKHFMIGGSIVSAIKKKNPLCLINPAIFSISF